MNTHVPESPLIPAIHHHHHLTKLKKSLLLLLETKFLLLQNLHFFHIVQVFELIFLVTHLFSLEGSGSLITLHATDIV